MPHLWNDEELVEQKYFDNEYDSLNRLIVCHQYDSDKKLENVQLMTYNEMNEVIKFELLNANYELEEYTLYGGGKKTSETINYSESFNAQGYLIQAVKDLKFTWNADPVKSIVDYEYNSKNEPCKIRVRDVINSLLDSDYFEEVYKTKGVGVLFSFSTNNGLYTTSYIHKNNELQTHPLAQEFMDVMQLNASQKKTE